MDRQIVYPGAIPLETDLLNTNKNAMIGLSKLAAAILGTSTFLNGLACTPTGPASLQVYVAPGEIYSLQNIDGTAYSSIAADTTHAILKQGISLDQLTLSCPAPVTAGQSINYLIQATYQDTDASAVVLPYYNSSNPSQAYAGPANSGTAQNTVRKGVCTVSAKAGVSATTGSQTTPAPDAGYIGAFVVTVAYGQTQITAPNISTYAGAPFMPSGGLVVGGLQGNACNISAAGGTADAITGSYSPGITALTNGMMLYVRAGSANATTTPTFTPGSGTIAADTIVKGTGLALVPGDIAGAGHWIELQRDATLGKWVLQNPATGISSSAGFENKAINPFFNINQDAVVSPATVAAGVYGHDGWKGGASGATYSFSKSGGITTPTITAGSILQVIEPDLVDSSTVTISWIGNAQGRVGAGAYAASPITVTGLTPGSSFNVEFNLGTVTGVFVKSGTIAGKQEKICPLWDLARCQYFYYLAGSGNGLDFGLPTNLAATGTNYYRFSLPHPVPMYGTPIITITAQTIVDRASGNLASNSGTTRNHAVFQGSVAAGSGAAQWTNVKFKADCRL